MAGIARDILVGAPARFALAGLSMGVSIALELVRQAPARVARLALLDGRAALDDDHPISITIGADDIERGIAGFEDPSRRTHCG
jgi:pimeloyl-ACP methyl ester carboxylesterase